jgi:dTDP-4-dehydrorhamnose 3,5-epimerase-like enzyme
MIPINSSTVNDCRLITLPKESLERGSISVVENQFNIPFDVKRIYYLYDVPSGSERGGHAHINLQQLILAASGSFDLVIDDGKDKRTFKLNNPNEGVLMPSGLWRELINFSSGAICLVLASHIYDESDYIRDYFGFLKYKRDEI